MAGTPHSDETRARAMAALMAGQGVDETAKEYNLPKATVSRWKKMAETGQFHADGTKKDDGGDRFGGLLATYLEETLTTLAEQQRHFRDKTWLAKQPASELAVLHGVSADKAIRLLEAAERAAEAGAELTPGD